MLRVMFSAMAGFLLFSGIKSKRGPRDAIASWRPGDRKGLGLDAVAVRVREEFLRDAVHREVEVGVLGRNRGFEPLLVELVERAVLHHADDGLVNQSLEGGVVLGEHRGVRFDGERGVDDLEVLRVGQVRNLAGEQHVVDHEGGGALLGDKLHGPSSSGSGS